MIDDQTLLAYLDGELEPELIATVEAAVAAEPSLASKLEAHRRLGARLRAAFDPVLSQAVPDPVVHVAKGAATVIDLAGVRAGRETRPRFRPDWRNYGALAATVIAVVAAGQAFLASRSAPVTEHGGKLIASGDLGHALDTQLSGGGGGIRVRITFRDRQGAVCRGFTGAAAGGVACRQDGRWTLKALFAGEGEAGGAYRMASSGDPRIMQVVDEMITGEPFDAAREHSAMKSRWNAAPLARNNRTP